MSELDLDAIEARSNAGVRQTTADADVLALVARVRELEQQLEQANRFGIGEFRATEWAYKQACAALEKQRDRADSAEAKLRRLQP